MASTRVRVGTSGWVYPHWRGAFYPRELPAARWFEHYAARFDTVEVNNCFYKLPEASTFREWADAAPPGFLYALKASRFLTHMKKLRDPEEPLDRFFTRAHALGAGMGPVLYQLPPRWGRDVARLRAFLAALPEGPEHVMEFRDPSWFHDDVRRALDERGVGFCAHDMPGAPSPAWATGRLAYARFHGPGEAKYAGRYGRRGLADRAAWLRERAAEAPAYAYFNNDIGGHAVADALTLREMLGA